MDPALQQQLRLSAALLKLSYLPGFISDPDGLELPPLGLELLDVFRSTTEAGRPYAFLARDAHNEAGLNHLVVRGTDDPAEWASNFRFIRIPCPFAPAGCETEQGFTEGYLSLVGRDGNTIWNILAGLPPRSLVGHGHSRGSPIAGYALVDNRVNCALGLIGWAMPQPGNKAFAAYSASRLEWTILPTNPHDVIPDVPGWWNGYQAIGEDLVLDPGGQFAHGPECSHAMDNYAHLVDESQPIEAGCAR